MNEPEAFKLLTLASARDNRTVDQPTAKVWATDLKAIDYDEAVAALSLHYSESTDWLMPAHVVRCVTRLRTKRALEDQHRFSIAERTRRAEEAERARLIRQGVLEP